MPVRKNLFLTRLNEFQLCSWKVFVSMIRRTGTTLTQRFASWNCLHSPLRIRLDVKLKFLIGNGTIHSKCKNRNSAFLVLNNICMFIHDTDMGYMERLLDYFYFKARHCLVFMIKTRPSGKEIWWQSDHPYATTRDCVLI